MPPLQGRHATRSSRRPSAPARIRAVCFDLDGVLIDTMPLHARAWQEAVRTIGLRVSKREIYLWEGESGRVTSRTLLARRRRGHTPSTRAMAALLRAKEQRFSRLARQITVSPVLVRLLRHLSIQRLRLALVTGTSAQEVTRVMPRRVLNRFEVIVTGDRVHRGKPHPEPYRRAFRRLRVRPREAVVVENAPYGIRSARRAGAGLIIALASSLPKRFLQEAQIVVSSPAQLSTCLRKLTACS